MIFLFKTPRTVNELAKICNRPWKLSLWLFYRIEWTSDRELYGVKEYWEYPWEVLIGLKADCEGYAMLAEAVLIKLGIETYMLTVFDREGHAVCIYRDKKRWNYLDNGWKKKGGSIREIAEKIYPSWIKYRLHKERVLLREVWNESRS